MYPEFQYRRPPPSYADSMQAYQVQMTDAQFNNNTINLVNNSNDNYSLPGSPPPSYRSRASTIHSGVHITFPPGHDSAPNSRPPTYRSRADSHQRPRLPMNDAEASSPGTAPADVSFTGPVMTAAAVQQIIGTNHRRQQSAGAVVVHRRSASVGWVQGSEPIHHRRGSSLDRGSASITHGASPQGNLTPLRQSREVPLDAEVTLRLTSLSSEQQFAPSEQQTSSSTEDTDVFQSTSYTDVLQSKSWSPESAGAHASLQCGAGLGATVDAMEDVISITNESQDSEPDQCNTSLWWESGKTQISCLNHCRLSFPCGKRQQVQTFSVKCVLFYYQGE